MQRAVFLDLDGTLVAMCGSHGPRSVHQLRLLPGVAVGCQELRQAGYLRFVVTNQPDIARGNMTWGDWLPVLNGTMAALQLDDSRVCPHDDADCCCCRKPEPGLLYALAYAHDVRLGESWYIGDTARDRGAAQRAGVQFVQVRHDRTFLECVRWILDHSESRYSAIPAA